MVCAGLRLSVLVSKYWYNVVQREKMQLQAAKTEKSLDDYRQLTDMAMSKGIYAGEAEMARVKAARAAEGESKE